MALHSMTGFGTARFQALGQTLALEIKTLNHRYFDLSFRAPRQFLRLETKIQAYLRKTFQRGRIECVLTVLDAGEQAQLIWDAAQAKRVAVALKDLAREAAVSDAGSAPTLGHLLTVRDVFEAAEAWMDVDVMWSAMEPGVREACAAAAASRKREGEDLRRDLKSRLQVLQKQHAAFAGLAGKASAIYRERLQARLHDALKDLNLSESVVETRLLQEVAYLVERSDVQEEITRLQHHLQAFDELLDTSGPVGRKMDFLVQEIHREFNTIGSKATQEEMIHRVVDSKTELERLREQVQNIE